MKPLFLKEVREQLALTLSALGIFSVMLALAFLSSRSQAAQAAGGYGSAAELQPLLATSLLTQAAFFCAMFGALLGFLQVRAEKHPDLWAFLVHRPIRPMMILWSKALSGLILYLIGAGLPILSLVLVVSMPGQVAAPFEWSMARPLLAILLGGLVAHGGGFLTGLRNARWYVSRGCGLGLPVIAMGCAVVAPEFWQALTILVLAGGTISLAVWGSFQTRGWYQGQPALGKVALTLTTAASALLVVALVGTLVVNFFWSSGGYGYSQYQLATDGEVLRLTHATREETVITDLAGQPVLDSATGRKLTLKTAQRRFASGPHVSVVTSKSGGRGGSTMGYAQPARYFLPWRVVERTLWYLEPNGRLLAFDGITRRAAGQIEPAEGQAGVTNVPGGLDKSGFLRFPNHYYENFQPYELPEVLASAHAAYLVDLSKRELRPILQAEAGGEILGYAQNVSPVSPSSNQVLVVTRQWIRLAGFDGRMKLQIPFDTPPSEVASVTVLGLSTGAHAYAVRFDVYGRNENSGRKILTRVKWVRADGTIDRSEDLPNLPEPTQNRAMENALLVLAPPILSTILSENDRPMDASPRIAAALIGGLVGLWLVRRHRFTLPATIGWVTFLVLMGVPGLLAFLAVQEWPAREPCPSCGRRRVINCEQCEHCGAPFAPPSRNGTEIFAPLNAP